MFRLRNFSPPPPILLMDRGSCNMSTSKQYDDIAATKNLSVHLVSIIIEKIIK